jgi:hypothetical protein
MGKNEDEKKAAQKKQKRDASYLRKGLKTKNK